jgi:hypothetical protein
MEQNILLKIFSFIFLNKKMQFTYPMASIKNVQATGEVFSPQKRTLSTSKHEISSLFSIFLGHFCPPGSRPTYPIESGSNSDPGPDPNTDFRDEKKLPYFSKFMITSWFSPSREPLKRMSLVRPDDGWFPGIGKIRQANRSIKLFSTFRPFFRALFSFSAC